MTFLRLLTVLAALAALDLPLERAADAHEPLDSGKKVGSGSLTLGDGEAGETAASMGEP